MGSDSRLTICDLRLNSARSRCGDDASSSRETGHDAIQCATTRYPPRRVSRAAVARGVRRRHSALRGLRNSQALPQRRTAKRRSGFPTASIKGNRPSPLKAERIPLLLCTRPHYYLSPQSQTDKWLTMLYSVRRRGVVATSASHYPLPSTNYPLRSLCVAFAPFALKPQGYL